MELNATEFFNTARSTTITQSTQNILLAAVIALLKYFSLKMCHITDPQAHYGAPCSQLSEPPCLEATVTKRGSQADLGAARPPQIHTYCMRRKNRKLTFGHCLGVTPLGSTLESGDRASDLYHGNNDLYLCQELRGLPQGARHLWRHVTVFGGESLHSAL